MTNNKELYKKALEKWGMEFQCLMAIEEMSELTHELTRLIRGKGEHENLLEEMADVKIMYEQLELILINDEFAKESFDSYYADKILRLESLVNKK